MSKLKRTYFQSYRSSPLGILFLCFFLHTKVKKLKTNFTNSIKTLNNSQVGTLGLKFIPFTKSCSCMLLNFRNYNTTYKNYVPSFYNICNLFTNFHNSCINTYLKNEILQLLSFGLNSFNSFSLVQLQTIGLLNRIGR